MSIAAPTIDSGFVTLSGSLADVPTTPASAMYLLGIYAFNPTAAAIVLEVTDVAGVKLIPDAMIASGAMLPLEFPFMPITGKPQWKGNGLQAKMWGYAAWPF